MLPVKTWGNYMKEQTKQKPNHLSESKWPFRWLKYDPVFTDLHKPELVFVGFSLTSTPPWSFHPAAVYRPFIHTGSFITVMFPSWSCLTEWAVAWTFMSCVKCAKPDVTHISPDSESMLLWEAQTETLARKKGKLCVNWLHKVFER